MKKSSYTVSGVEKIVENFNIVLIILFFLLITSFLYLGLFSTDKAGKIILQGQGINSNLPVLSLAKQSSKYYERILGRRQLFVAHAKMKTNTAREDFDSQILVQDLLSDFQLMGIVSGASGLQAIIMNLKTGQSFYCSGGEKLSGFKIKEVLENKIRIEINGKIEEILL